MANPFPPNPRGHGTPVFQWSPQKILIGVVVLFIAVGCLSSFYVVPTNAVGIVQRFGAYYETTQPGLQFKLPWGIDSATVVPVGRTQKLEFGFGTRGATNVYQYAESPAEQEAERSMVTGDLNSANVEWIVFYHISDPQKFLFNFNDATATLRDVSEAVMREVVGDRTIDEVLTFGRQELATEAEKRMQKITESLGLGINVNQVQLQDVKPPRQVQSSFDEVNKAQQEKEQAINIANGEYNKQVPLAKGEAERKLTTAIGYATKRVNEAEGDAKRFNSLLAEYLKAPDVTRRRIYLETMNEILPFVKNKIVVDEKAPQFLPMMQVPAVKSANQQPPSSR